MTYRLAPSGLEDAYLTALEGALLASPHFGPSPLGSEFVDTKGFSIVFRRSALGRVIEQFPYLEAFLAACMFRSSNAFYVNPLMLHRGSRVDPHVDCRLVATQDVRIVPTLVSVLYVRAAPEMKGGALRLAAGRPDEIVVRPARSDLLHFVGKLVHSVDPIESDHERISVVCEQYHLEPDVLAGFPELDIIA